jgi:hypothetical protein
MAVTPPGVDFGFVGVNRSLGLVWMAMNREALFFPSANGALAAFEVGGNFFPRVQAVFGGRFGGVIAQFCRIVFHGPSVSRSSFAADIIKADSPRATLLQKAVKCGHPGFGRNCLLFAFFRVLKFASDRH